jgi:hypothetical protein
MKGRVATRRRRDARARSSERSDIVEVGWWRQCGWGGVGCGRGGGQVVSKGKMTASGVPRAEDGEGKMAETETEVRRRQMDDDSHLVLQNVTLARAWSRSGIKLGIRRHHPTTCQYKPRTRWVHWGCTPPNPAPPAPPSLLWLSLLSLSLVVHDHSYPSRGSPSYAPHPTHYLQNGRPLQRRQHRASVNPNRPLPVPC